MAEKLLLMHHSSKRNSGGGGISLSDNERKALDHTIIPLVTRT
jgi:hypothetical protein